MRARRRRQRPHRPRHHLSDLPCIGDSQDHRRRGVRLGGPGPGLLQQPRNPLPPEPHHLRRYLALHLPRRPLLRRRQTQAASTWPATTDCAQLTFNPSQSIEPTTTAADSPSGAEFRLTVPQFESPCVPSPSELRAADVTLPEGFSLAPNVTNGKDTCSEAQPDAAPSAPPKKPTAPKTPRSAPSPSKPPSSPAPSPAPSTSANPSPATASACSSLFDGFGVHVKLPGTITPDPADRPDPHRLPEPPPGPLRRTSTSTSSAPSAAPSTPPPSAAPTKCRASSPPGTPSLPDQTSRQFFTVTEGPERHPLPERPPPLPPRPSRPPPPSNTAAAHTSFSLDLTREDGEQNLASLKLTTPPGFAATLKGVSYCPEAAIAAAALETHTGLAEQASPSCPASSQVGELTAGAGPGNHPLYLPGKVYLAGPYQGAPLSFVFITPAVSGGYDLGNVVVREALHVNPETAQVTAVGDPLPQIFQGIPLRLRQILVNLNRPNFALNPTDCNPLAVNAAGLRLRRRRSPTASQHFQVANCASPRLHAQARHGLLRLHQAGRQPRRPRRPLLPLRRPLRQHLPRRRHPSPHRVSSTTLTSTPPAPRSSSPQARSPAKTVRRARSSASPRPTTPLLEKPLEGPVYLRTHRPAHGLPDIVAALNGQIDIALVGQVDTVDGRIRTTFETVPDAPVSNFTLSLDGGHKGLLENKPNLCAHPLHVTADITGQNGKTANQNPLLSTPVRQEASQARPSGTS